MIVNKKGLTSPKKREFVEEILSLCKLNRVIAFAVGLRYPATASLTGIEPNTFRVISLLCERVEVMMEEQYPEELATIVFDSQEDKKDKARALEFGNYLYGTPVGRGAIHVCSIPMFTSSLVTKGIQIADLFAYAIAQQNMGRTDVMPFCDRIRELEWHAENKLDDRPWHGFVFRDMTAPNEERIGDSPQSLE